MNRKLLFVLFIAFTLSACAPDPRREAQAFATRSQAEQEAADQVQQRAQSADSHALQMKHQEAVAQEWEAGLNVVIHYASIFASIAMSMSVMAAGVGLSLALIGTGQAAGNFAKVRSNLIPLNPVTRQYPLLITYAGKGRYTLANPNTNSVLLLDTRSEPDRQMILGMSNTQYAGALAHEARLSLKPGDIAAITAPVQEVVDA